MLKGSVSIKMRKNLKGIIAIIISGIAMVVATMSSSMCWWFLYEEDEMPKSLIKQD